MTLTMRGHRDESRYILLAFGAMLPAGSLFFSAHGLSIFKFYRLPRNAEYHHMPALYWSGIDIQNYKSLLQMACFTGIWLFKCAAIALLVIMAMLLYVKLKPFHVELLNWVFATIWIIIRGCFMLWPIIIFLGLARR
jgi:hypothetical protein